MKREIKTGQHHIQSLPVPDDLATELRQWLAAQTQPYGLNCLLAHADDGVIWGQVRDGGWHLSGDAFPAISPPLRAVTLQQVRLFGPTAELLLWKDGTGWRARLIRDDAGESGEYYDESHLLWGDKEEEPRDGFVLVRQGKEGLRHAPPLLQGAPLPARLQVRHYLAYDLDGQAYIAYGRLVALHQGGAQ
ncbi:MAG TPA: CRISPR-associated protein Csx19 [Anaerolineae bacterium]|nr:CRISPR-associated protein Csx19 [Anaerolineae bacterium]